MLRRLITFALSILLRRPEPRVFVAPGEPEYPVWKLDASGRLVPAAAERASDAWRATTGAN